MSGGLGIDSVFKTDDGLFRERVVRCVARKSLLTDEQQAELHYQRFHHPHPRVQKKMEALWLKSQNLAHKEICRLVGISPNTLRSYIKDFQNGKVDGLKRLTRHEKVFDAWNMNSSLKTQFLRGLHIETFSGAQ